MSEKKYFLISEEILPPVLRKVLLAKKMLSSGQAKNISEASRMADISRSVFYKYKDGIFEADYKRETITLEATLLDETGALQALLAAISAAGAGIVTINQSTPEHGTAFVAVSIRTATMQMSVEELLQKLKKQRTVKEIVREE